jgi:hypothetical protein
VLSLFSLHRLHLTLLFADQSSVNEAGHISDEQKKREGRIALDVTTTVIDSGQAAEYGNTSATYWNLYLSEAEINDQSLVDSVEADTRAMELVVSLSAPPV